MKKSDLTYVLGCTYATAVGLFYCSVRWFSIKLPRYYPTLHVWKTARVPGVPSQGWYAMQGFAYLGAAVVTVAVWLILKYAISRDTVLRPGMARTLGLVTSAVLVFCLGYICYYEFSHWGIL